MSETEVGTIVPDLGTAKPEQDGASIVRDNAEPLLSTVRDDPLTGPFDSETHLLVRWTHTVDNPRGRPHLPPTRRSKERIRNKVVQVPRAYRVVPRALWEDYESIVLALTTLDKIIDALRPPVLQPIDGALTPVLPTTAPEQEIVNGEAHEAGCRHAVLR